MLVYCTAKTDPAMLMKAAEQAQVDLSRKALEDCNKYCKVDSGKLRASSLKASDLRRGRLVWRSEYARNAYYTGGANRDKNPLASKMWAHKAAMLHGGQWQKSAAEMIGVYLQKSGSDSQGQKQKQNSEVS